MNHTQSAVAVSREVTEVHQQSEHLVKHVFDEYYIKLLTSVENWLTWNSEAN